MVQYKTTCDKKVYSVYKTIHSLKTVHVRKGTLQNSTVTKRYIKERYTDIRVYDMSYNSTFQKCS
jgi:hypothetical protein